MTDPLRPTIPEAGEVPERERDARVEELLLAGLDHYFVGQHELAISVWTRVLFLDRGHARARAYIERARSAIAERQREGEELLHTGAAAFDRGDAGAARTAPDLGGRARRAQRGGAGAARAARIASSRPACDPRARWRRHLAPMCKPPRTGQSVARPAPRGLPRACWPGSRRQGSWPWIASTRPDWFRSTPRGRRAADSRAEEPLPVPSPSEVWVARARGLYEDGRLARRAAARSGPDPSPADALRAAARAELELRARSSSSCCESARLQRRTRTAASAK